MLLSCFCRLSPLTVCAPSVAQQFLQQADRLSLMDCSGLQATVSAAHLQVCTGQSLCQTCHPLYQVFITSLALTNTVGGPRTGQGRLCTRWRHMHSGWRADGPSHLLSSDVMLAAVKAMPSSRTISMTATAYSRHCADAGSCCFWLLLRFLILLHPAGPAPGDVFSLRSIPVASLCKVSGLVHQL